MVTVVIASLLGGLILKRLARGIGKIETANYKNSFLVCLISNVSTMIIVSSITSGVDPGILLSFNVFTGMIILSLILPVAYIIAGKIIWKCAWRQSLKVNIIWGIPWILSIAFLYLK